MLFHHVHHIDESIFQEYVDEEDHARTLEILIHQYDEHGDTYELLDSIESDEFKKELTDIHLDTCIIKMKI